MTETTLGVAGPLLSGLCWAARLAEEGRVGADRGLSDACRDAAMRLRAGLVDTFGPLGWVRRAGPGGALDASVALLLPPFGPAEPDILAAFRRATVQLHVSNGGLRPGVEWPDPVTAWTPQVSLFAATAAHLGDRELATRLLDWLDAHRTRLGSLPEKVTQNGRPAAVAPLAITTATVLIAVAALDGRPLPPTPLPVNPAP